MAMGRPPLKNILWRIGESIIIDVSTSKHPGATAIIDINDSDLVFGRSGRWHARQSPKYHRVYASRHVWLGNGKGTIENMHTLIIPTAEDKVTDHKNRDGLDNRKHNLRQCSQRENCANRSGVRGRSSTFKGVSWCTTRQKWIAQICVKYRRLYIGAFATADAAARAYDASAIANFGEFAQLNFRNDPDA